MRIAADSITAIRANPHLGWRPFLSVGEFTMRHPVVIPNVGPEASHGPWPMLDTVTQTALHLHRIAGVSNMTERYQGLVIPIKARIRLGAQPVIPSPWSRWPGGGFKP